MQSELTQAAKRAQAEVQRKREEQARNATRLIRWSAKQQSAA